MRLKPRQASASRRTALSLVTALLLAGVVLGAPKPRDNPVSELGEHAVVRSLAPGVWLHLTFDADAETAPATANGLLVETGDTSLLIDTGWTRDQTGRLLKWAEERLGKPVRNVVLSDGNRNRIEALGALEGRPITIHAHAAAAESLRAAGFEGKVAAFEFETLLEPGGERVFLFFPGPGHSPGNALVWLPGPRVLFGGEFVRSLESSRLGDPATADLNSWPVAFRRVIERFRDARIVVPAHGRVGGPELLSHTMELLEKPAR